MNLDRQEHFCIFNSRTELGERMRKFLLKLFFACIPILIYVCAFVAFEPYNYFGLKTEKVSNWATPLARVRTFMHEPSAYIILGDSRMKDFDLNYVEELTGEQYANLSTGGQGLNQTKELYDWIRQKIDVEKIVMDVSFYQIRWGNNGASVIPVLYIAEHPLDYIVTRDYVIETFEQIQKSINQKVVTNNANIISTLEEESTSGKYREDLVIYATENIYPGCQNYKIGEEQMKYVTDILIDMENSGKEVILVTPPIQDSIWEYVIEPMELEAQMNEYKERLSEYAPIYDMEWKNEFTANQDNYADGFHLTGELYKVFTDNVFGQQKTLVREWKEH